MSDPNPPMNEPQGAPPPPPEPTGAPGSPPQAGAGYGDLGKRFLARLIDALLVGIPLSVLLAVLPGVRLGGVISGAVVGVASFAYFLFLETSQGATLGKQWLGLAVADGAGTSPIGMDASVRRNWWMLLGVIQGIPIIGWLAGIASLVVVIVIAATISSDARNQGWHDKLAGTFVVERARA